VVLVPTQKDTKRETVLTLNLVKSYQVSNRKCNEPKFFKNCSKSCLGKSGSRATCGRLQRLQWPAEAFRKIFKSEISSSPSQ